MELGRVFSSPATPALPLPPRPTGHATDLPLPTRDFHSGLILERYSVKMYVVPEPSDRCATEMRPPGRRIPGFSFASWGSFQVLILPRKMSAMTGPVRCSPVLTPGTL